MKFYPCTWKIQGINPASETKTCLPWVINWDDRGFQTWLRRFSVQGAVCRKAGLCGAVSGPARAAQYPGPPLPHRGPAALVPGVVTWAGWWICRDSPHRQSRRAMAQMCPLLQGLFSVATHGRLASRPSGLPHWSCITSRISEYFSKYNLLGERSLFLQRRLRPT